MSVCIGGTLMTRRQSIGVIAGINRYRFTVFLTFVILGRMAWTSAYVGLGYALGGSLEAATAFLSTFTGLAVSLLVLAAAALVALGRVDQRSPQSSAPARAD